LGSTSVVLDKATSEFVERSTFEGYGATESDYRPGRWQHFREDYKFTGKEEDAEVGLQYFGKRYLNAHLGRWPSADPLALHSPGEADGNLYAYVAGSVLKNIDPNGLESVDGAKLRWASEAETRTYLSTIQMLRTEQTNAQEALDFHLGVMMNPESGKDYEMAQIWANYWRGEQKRLDGALIGAQTKYAEAKAEFSRRYDAANADYLVGSMDSYTNQHGDRSKSRGRVVTGDAAARREAIRMDAESNDGDRAIISGAGPTGIVAAVLASVWNACMPKDMQVKIVDAVKLAGPVDAVAKVKAGQTKASSERHNSARPTAAAPESQSPTGTQASASGEK